MAQDDPGPIAQRVILGLELRDARQECGLTSQEATSRLGWYSGRLSKIEAGDRVLTRDVLDQMIEVYGIEPETAEALRRLAADSRRKVPPARVAGWAAKYVNLVASAQEIKLFYSDSFPGTVQTFDYASAMLSKSVVVSPADVERMAEERFKRVDRLKRTDAPRLWLVVGEEALYREIGGRAVLREQLVQIVELSRLPNINVQVIPFKHGEHSSHGTSFSIVTPVEGKSLVYEEGLSGSDYLGGTHVRIYTLAFDNLRADALSLERTIELINRRISEL
jgi:transcriptional regulator with XRE-family HTH domain